jgi:hypothetical protein
MAGIIVISPSLVNGCLNELDWWMEEKIDEYFCRPSMIRFGRRQVTHARCRGRAVPEKGGREVAREMHEERRAGRRGGEAKAATGCDELGGATHGELPSSIRRSRQEQRSADLTHSARPAAVVGRP